MVRYESRSVGGVKELTQAREMLGVAYAFSTLHAEGLWNSPVIGPPLQMFELSQLGIVVFVQNIHRVVGGVLMHAEVSGESADVVVALVHDRRRQGSLRVTMPLTPYDPGLRGEPICCVLEVERAMMNWLVPRASRRGITIPWQRVERDGWLSQERYYLDRTPLSEW